MLLAPVLTPFFFRCSAFFLFFPMLVLHSRAPTFAASFRIGWRESVILNYGRLLKNKPVLSFSQKWERSHQEQAGEASPVFSLPQVLRAELGTHVGARGPAPPSSSFQPSRVSDLDSRQTFPSWQKRPFCLFDLFRYFQQ